MAEKIRSFVVRDIMNAYSLEAKSEEMFYQIIYDSKLNVSDVYIYTTRPGQLIGLGGKLINKYAELCKAKGINSIKLVEVETCRIPDVRYGMDICPTLSGGEPCYDYERLGTMACGLCGANPEMAGEGRKNFIRGMEKNIKEMNQKWGCSICGTKYTAQEWANIHKYDDICDRCVPQAKRDGIIKE